jgi:hypothetical protein
MSGDRIDGSVPGDEAWLGDLASWMRATFRTGRSSLPALRGRRLRFAEALRP